MQAWYDTKMQRKANKSENRKKKREEKPNPKLTQSYP
jgi:hypothetical protein